MPVVHTEPLPGEELDSFNARARYHGDYAASKRLARQFAQLQGQIDDLTGTVDTYAATASGDVYIESEWAAYSGPPLVWIVPNTETELFGETIHRTHREIPRMRVMRLLVNVKDPCASGCFLRALFSDDNGGTWQLPGHDGVATSIDVAVFVDASGLKKSGWKFINPEARIEAGVLFRVTADDGDATASGIFGNIAVQFRSWGDPTTTPEEA